MALEDEIYEVAAKAAPPGAEEESLRALCRAASLQLTARLKDGITAEDCKEAFVCAAAYLALGMMVTRVQAVSSSVESFTVGDVSIKTGSSAGETSGTGGYFSRAEVLMRPFLKSSGFAFVGVRG